MIQIKYNIQYILYKYSRRSVGGLQFQKETQYICTYIHTTWQKQPVWSPSSIPWPISFVCKLLLNFFLPQTSQTPHTKKYKIKSNNKYMLTTDQTSPGRTTLLSLRNRPDECLEMAYLYLNKYKRFQSSSSPSLQHDPLDDTVRLSPLPLPLWKFMKIPFAKKVVWKRNTIFSCLFVYLFILGRGIKIK